MKISELRQTLSRYSSDELQQVIIEMYKLIPPKLREDKDIDALLQNPGLFIADRKAKKAAPTTLDMDALEASIKQFLVYAYNQYYLAPNRFVHKKDRPRWRFMVKEYLKQLACVPAVCPEETPRAAILSSDLYEMLCYASGYYLFNSDNPFRSVGISQTDVFRQVLTLSFQVDTKPVFLHKALRLMLNNFLDRETLYEYLMFVLLDFLKTPDLLEMTIEQCQIYYEETKHSSLKNVQRVTSRSDTRSARESILQDIAIMMFFCCQKLHDIDRGINYFWQYYISSDPEIALYVLLRLLRLIDAKNYKSYWIQEYENAIKKGIKPREELALYYLELTDL